MNALDVLCAQLTRDLFAIAKFLLTIGRLLLHCWYSLGRPVTIGTPIIILLFWLSFDCYWLFWRLVHRWYTVGTVLADLWRLVHQWLWLFLTIGTVYHSSKTVKRQSKQQNHHWFTNRHMSTQSPPNTQSRANALRDLHHNVPGQWPQPVARGQGWLYVSTMDVHASGSRSLPRAATLSSTYWWCLQLVIVCQVPSSNFPYFRTPLANFLLSRPNSVEYGNSKTTTLLPSAKCTRPLFQGRTGCGGRLSGWHDIVTCQRLVESMSVCRTVSKIFNVKKRRDLETVGKGRSRSLKMAPLDRSYDFLLVSHCKNSCMLYHFQVIWRWIIVTLKRSLKVIQTGTIRKLGCGFLFTFHSTYGRIFNRLWDIQRQNIAWPWKLG